MNRPWRALGVVVLIVAMLGSASAQSPLPFSAHEKPSGCHQHGNSTPLPSPDNHYQCCIAGHESAIVQPPVVSQMPVATTPLAVEPARQIISRTAALTNDIAAFSPPDAIPLRI
jgi:hypothetical protein